MTTNSRNLLRALIASVTMGAASSVIAAPVFSIDLSAVTGGPSSSSTIFTGDFFSGTSTELLNTVGTSHEGSGWMQISGLSNNAVGQVPFGAGAGYIFNMYVTFTLKDHLISGSMNAPGSKYALDELNFQLWVDKDKDTILTNAKVTGGVATGATVTGGVANDYILGFGSLLTGVASLSDLGGAGLNSINAFGLCNGAGTGTVGAKAVAYAGCTNDVGSKFFFDPKPFYDLAFTEFNNTAQGYAIGNKGELVINSASGGVDFNRIPEPTTLALAGIGLMGLGFSAKRRKSS